MDRRTLHQEPKFLEYCLVALAILLIASVVFTMKSSYQTKSKVYDKQIEASSRAEEAMSAIKQYKIDNGIKFEKEDKYNSGMIGLYYSDFTTTSGDVKAKRTACNPNFAALFVKLFYEAGLKEGDEIAICESGSFPTLNISALVASEVYGLKTCIMVTCGSSSYGSNDKNFTYFDMAEYLYSIGLVSSRTDYVSFGGSNDSGSEFDSEITSGIYDRIESSGVPLISVQDYDENCRYRMSLIYEKCPDLKLFLNIGGNLVSMGRDLASAIYYRGYVEPSNIKLSVPSDSENLGLIDRFLLKEVPIIQMLNIKGLSMDYGLPYDPDRIPQVGQGDVYYETSYDIIVPIISLSITASLLLAYYIYRKKEEKETNEKPDLLC